MWALCKWFKYKKKKDMQTIIFGAGASVPFFYPRLNTSYLTRKVSDIDEWDRVMRKYRQYEPNNVLVSPADVMSVIDEITRLKSDAHFEEIAEVIDKISSVGFDHLPRNNMMNLQMSVMASQGFLGNNATKPLGPEWRDVPFLFREIIAEAILELESNHKAENYLELESLQRSFIGHVSEMSENTSVLSFNYDDCVINSLEGLGFEKGFSSAGQYYLRQLDTEKFMKAKKVVYFPHGHVKFQFTDNDNVTFWGDSEVANQERWEGVNGAHMGSTLTLLNGKYAYNFNTFITTGQTKDDSLNHLPYSAYYQRLASDLANSNVVYIIGYSFGDDHVNRLLQTFLKMDSGNKVYVIDYYPDMITLTDEYTTQSNIINKIHLVLGTEWQVMFDSGVKRPFDQAKVDEINACGYGEIFNQVVFYKKGYDAFLNEFENVI